jgi:hypothetical protein
MSITYREYWTEVDRLAEELSSTPEELEESYGSDDAYEILNQMIDSHEFIIYTAKALKVMEYTDNDDAYFEEMGGPPQVDSFSSLLPPLAYFAMQADVLNRMSRANPTQAHSHGYGRRARRNYPPQKHLALHHEWRRAADSAYEQMKQARSTGMESEHADARAAMNLAHGRATSNMQAAHGLYDLSMHEAKAAARSNPSPRLRLAAEGHSIAGEKQRRQLERKWTREKQPNGLTVYAKSYRGAGTCFVVAYKPRKSRLAREYAADYERDRGRKIPKGTKWLSCFKSVGRTDMIIGAHKSLKAAKALCDSNGGIRSNPGHHSAPKRKSAKSNPPRFKVKVKSSSKAKPKLVQVPAGARAQRVGSNVVHRALSYAGGKWKMLKGWAVSTRGGLLVSRHKTKALAVKAAGK